MKAKIICIVIILIIIALGIIIGISNGKKDKKRKEYTITSNERIEKKFTYNNYEYQITSYSTEDSSYLSHHILMKRKEKYYRIESISKCDMSYFLKENELYIHCIGKKGDILKYTLKGESVEQEVIELNYDSTPNTSQIHLTIDNVTDDFIYLHSNIKNNEKVSEGENITCSLITKTCKYQNEE